MANLINDIKGMKNSFANMNLAADNPIFELDPPRAALSNLESAETMRFQFNPPQFTENWNVNYARHTVPGLSYQVLQYINTNNERLPLEIYLSDILARADQQILVPGIAIPTTASTRSFVGPPEVQKPFDLDDRKRFMQSLVFPRRSESGGRQSPPSVMFLWPNVIRITAKVTQLSFQHRKFSIESLKTTVLMAILTLEECSGVQRYSQDVRETGSLHAQSTRVIGF